MGLSAEILYDEPEWLILLALLTLLGIAGEIGYRLGRRKQSSAAELARAQVSNIQSALLGLFALLLGFTFAMALARFDLRKQMIVQEANAIGTSALLARLLPEAQRTQMAELFRRYVDVRVTAGEGPNLATPDRQELQAEAGRIQEQMWQQGSAAAAADPRSVPTGMFLRSLNEVIDVKGERDAALANHVPESVLLLLFAFATLTSAMLGYGHALAGPRAPWMAAILFLLIALVILVIIDLDRPGRGLITVSQKSMIDLQQSLLAPK